MVKQLMERGLVRMGGEDDSRDGLSIRDDGQSLDRRGRKPELGCALV
jgi:hypothetical protein